MAVAVAGLTVLLVLPLAGRASAPAAWAALGLWSTIAVVVGSRSRHLAPATRQQLADAALVNAADTAMITTCGEGLVHSWNPAASQLYGVRQEDAIGRHIADVVESPPDDPSRGTDGRLESIRYATTHHRRDGTPIVVEVTAWPVPTPDGDVVMGMLVRDITSHRAAEVQLRLHQERFRVFAEQSHGVVYRFEVRPGRRLAFLSPRIADLLGLDPHTVRTDPMAVLSRIHPEDWLPFNPATGTGRFDAGVHLYRVQHADGSWVWVEDHHRPEHDQHGRLVATQGILYDVSARKQLEQARERALADAQETARQLERTTLAQSVFLRSVSHQLRTPMTVVRGFTTTLRRHGDQLDEDTRALLVERLLDGAARLDARLSDLLELQTIDDEAGQRRDAVDLEQLCFEAVSTIDTSQHRIALATTRDCVRGDRRQLARAVTALVRNAVQHTPSGTSVAVEMHRTDDTVRLSVRDDGPGVDGEILDRVFEPFVQGRAAATSHAPGTGIGLTFVRQVALRHGGSVRCRPLTPNGVQFDLVLPLAPAAAHVST